jgi:uncharacterized protein (DUF488 family)
MQIYTVGHSTRSIDEFLGTINTHGIKLVVDVRRFPTSSKFPHFSRDRLSKSLSDAGIAYLWKGDLLGGMRTGGYQAYTQTDDFSRGLSQLEITASQQPTCIMCAEKLFFRCHRRFIADILVQRGWEVIHIIDKSRSSQHNLKASPSLGS